MTTRKTVFFAVALILAASPGLFASGAKPAAEPGETYRFLQAIGPWDLKDGRIPTEEQPDDPYFQYVEEQIGIVPLNISWEWEGSKGYTQGLRLALAGGEEIESLRPWDELLANELIESGVAIPIGDLLDEYGQDVKEFFSEDDFEVMRATQGGDIYYLPQTASTLAARFGYIRKDWLERVGMDVPETREELVQVYRAFKAQDANGNGDPNDEIPVSGRELLRWFDDLFVMHGVAMWEGHPQWKWNPAKGILESSQVSDSMKMALEFIHDLYEEGLMDQVMPVQPNADWTAKIGASKIGHYFHLIFQIPQKSTFVGEDPNPDPTGMKYWEIMVQPPKVPGVPRQKNYYPTMQEPNFMVTKYAKDPAKIIQWLNWGCQEEQWYYKSLGIPGVDWVREGGELKILKERPAFWISYAGGYGRDLQEIVLGTPMGELQLEFNARVQGKTIPLDNQGMPISVYEGYEDYLPYSCPMYREWASKFITGDIAFSQWDDYVEQWYENGGQVVTDRATEWYKKIHGIK